MLNKFGNIRFQVASILNKLIGQDLDIVLFTPDNTFKNPGANRHKSKYDMMTTGNWYARGEELTGTKFIWVDCNGYVKSIDKENNRINLFLSEWIELVSVPITKKTPKWLLSDDRIIGFRSKVFLHWRNLKKN